MDKLEATMEISTLAILATKKVAFGSSLLGSMIIFQDPAYFIIATTGAFVSSGSAYYDILKIKAEKKRLNEECYISTPMELGKAFLVGFIISLLSFMLFLQAGGEAMKAATGMSWFDKLLPSFWLVFTVALSTESSTIWDSTWGRGKRWLQGDK